MKTLDDQSAEEIIETARGCGEELREAITSLVTKSPRGSKLSETTQEKLVSFLCHEVVDMYMASLIGAEILEGLLQGRRN